MEEPINRPTRLVFVRHAESLRNRLKGKNVFFPDDESRAPVKGIPDHLIPLTEHGEWQADVTGIALAKRFGSFDYAYHSGFKRTFDTLTRILNGYDEQPRSRIKVRMNDFIRERHAGYTYDMTTAEVRASFPWFHDYWRTFGGYYAQPPGGESLANVTSRVYQFLNMLFRDRAGKSILIVTHGGTLRCFRSLLEHWDHTRTERWPAGQSPKNCGVTVYEYDSVEERLVLRDYNSVYY